MKAALESTSVHSQAYADWDIPRSFHHLPRPVPGAWEVPSSLGMAASALLILIGNLDPEMYRRKFKLPQSRRCSPERLGKPAMTSSSSTGGRQPSYLLKLRTIRVVRTEYEVYRQLRQGQGLKWQISTSEFVLKTIPKAFSYGGKKHF